MALFYADKKNDIGTNKTVIQLHTKFDKKLHPMAAQSQIQIMNMGQKSRGFVNLGVEIYS